MARSRLRNARLRRQPYFSLHIYLLPVKPEKSVFVLLLWFVWAELEAEASLPGKDTKTLSTDLIEYVQYMIREHNQDYKVRTTKLGPQWLSSGFNSKLQLLHFTANFLSYSWKFHKNKQVLTKWPLLMCVTHGLCKRHPISAAVTASKHVRACFILFKGEIGRSMCHLCVSWACNSENNHVVRINIKYTAVIAQKNHLILRGSDQRHWLL